MDMEDDYYKSIEEKIKDITAQTHEFQTKFVYYILAVDAACIGFSVNYNKNVHFSLFLIPFIVAVISWLISFHFGIKELSITDLMSITNAKTLQAQRIDNFKILDIYYQDFEKFNIKIVKVSKYKMWFLYIGVISFLISYFLKMFLG